MTHFNTSGNSNGSHYARINTGLTNRIITELVAQTETLGDDLPPLYQSIDPDALEALFAPKDDGSKRSEGHVTFTHAGHHITVSSDGTVDITPSDNQPE